MFSSSTVGDYVYTYKVFSGSCPVETAEITITVVDEDCTTDIEKRMIANLSVYPNPVTTQLNIVNPSNISKLKAEMIDVNGRVVLNRNIANEGVLAIDHLESGVYTLRVYSKISHKIFKIVKY